MIQTVELVLARYNEDPTWADDLGVPVQIYNKGDAMPAEARPGPHLRVEPLPNVGREAHTWLFHIARRWEALADWTLFAQADPWPHVGNVEVLRALLRPCGAFRVPRRCRVREWGDDGRLRWDVPGWQERFAAGEIRPAALNLVDYFRARLGVELDPKQPLVYGPGACFGVSRDAIRRHDRPYYARLLETVFEHVHPEEAHYLERGWPRIFTDGRGW